MENAGAMRPGFLLGKPACSLDFKLVEKARSYQQEFDKPNPNS
jgi:hypothetical protein